MKGHFLGVVGLLLGCGAAHGPVQDGIPQDGRGCVFDIATKMARCPCAMNAELPIVARRADIRALELHAIEPVDVSPLTPLRRMHRLVLNDAEVRGLGALTQLRDLIMPVPHPSVAAQLQGLSLHTVTLTRRYVGSGRERTYPYLDVRLFAKMTQMRELHLQHATIDTLEPLAGLKNLRVLEVRLNQRVDGAALAGLRNLEKLALHGTPVDGLDAAIGALDNLKDLHLDSSYASIELTDERFLSASNDKDSWSRTGQLEELCALDPESCLTVEGFLCKGRLDLTKQ